MHYIKKYRYKKLIRNLSLMSLIILLCLTMFYRSSGPSYAAVYPAQWQMGTSYAVGAQVTYNQNIYQCISGHQAIDGWQPPLQPSLWNFVKVTEILPWQIGIAYGAGNVVKYNGSYYLCTNANTAIDGWQPDITITHWTPTVAITGITSNTANGAYTTGNVIDVRITFSAAVTVTGTPLLTLNTGSKAVYSSGSGTNTLVFNYTVQSGDNTADLDVFDPWALSLSGGTTIEHAPSKAAILILPIPGSADSLGTGKNISINSAVGAGDGLIGKYYNNRNLTEPSTLTRVDSTINFEWAAGSPHASINLDEFSVSWSGKIQPQFSETYTFYTYSDEGVRLWIDGQLIIDKWYFQGPTEWSGTVSLTAGRKYDIVLQYFEGWGSAQAKLSWASPSLAKQVVPAECLYSSVPSVTGITSSKANGAYKAGEVIPIEVSFSEPVVVTGTPQLALNTGRSVDYTGGSGTNKLNFNYTVQAGDNTSDLDYSNTGALSLNGGTIKAQVTGINAALALAAPGGAGSLGGNKNIVIDTAAPLVSNVTSTAGNGLYKIGDIIAISVAFNDNVTVTGTPELALNSGAVLNYSSGSGTGTLTFNYTIQEGNYSTDLEYTSTDALTLNGGSIKDAAGNDAVLTLPAVGGAGSLGTNKNIGIDGVLPNVTNVTSSNGNATYKAGDVIQITVTLNEPVTVIGTPRISLNSGGVANYVSGSPGNTLVFSYTVQSGDSSGDLNYVNTNSLTLNGGSIKDAAANNANLALPAVAGAGSLGTNKNIVIDGVAPTVNNVTATNGNGSYHAGDEINITVSFSDNVVVTGTPLISLNTGRSAGFVDGNGTNALTFRYTVQAGDSIADLNYANTSSLTLNGGTIRDNNGNDAVLTLPATGGAGSLGTNKDIRIDTTAPGVNNVTSPDNNRTYKIGEPLSIVVTFTEAVNVTGVPQLTLNTGRTINYVSGSGSVNLVFSYTVGTGDNTADLNYQASNSLALNGATIRDDAGNDAVLTLPATNGAGSLGTNKNLAIDGVAPAVTNVTSTNGNGSYKSGSIITVTVMFNDTVTVTGTPQLSLNTGRTINFAGGSGSNTLSFNYTVQAGDTASDLNYANINSLTLNGGSIKDASGNDASLALPATGGVGSLGTNRDIVIDTTAPGVADVTSTNGNGNYKLGDTIAVTIRFSESVYVTGTPQLALNTGRTINYGSGSGTNTLTFNYTVGAGDTAADLNYVNTGSLSLNGGSIKDLAGNDAGLTLPATGGAGALGTNKDIRVDGVVPYVTNVTSTNSNGTYKAGDTISVTVRFNETVNVAGTPRLALNTGRTVNYTAGTGSDTLTFSYVVQVGDQISDLNYVDTGSLTLNGGTIKDTVNNDAVVTLPLAGAAGSLGSNKDIAVDGTAPQVQNVTSTNGNGNYKTGDVITVTVRFSEIVNVTGTPRLSLNTGKTIDYNHGSGTDTLSFNYTVEAGDTASDLNYVNTGSLVPNGGSIKDGAGNNASLTLPATGDAGSLGTNKDLVIDAQVPSVNYVTSTTANGTYSAGATIAVTVRFSENVVVTGTPQLALNTGRTAVYSSGTGSDLLTFNYTVLAGDVSGDLDYSSTSALILNGGTIKDGAGNNGTLTLAAVGTPNSLGGSKDIVIAAGTSGKLYGGVENAPGSVNLTLEGTEDWAHWGLIDENSFTHKNGVAQKISDSSTVLAGPKSHAAGSTTKFTWTDGNPSANNVDIAAGIYASGVGNGLEFTIPAGTQQKTLNVYLGATDIRGKIEAILSDGSASDYVAYIDNNGTTYKKISLTFKAQNPGETLRVKFTIDTMHDINGRAILQAASLASPVVTKVTTAVADGAYKSGQLIPITVKFSSIVDVTGTPQLALNTGATVNYSGGDGTDTLTFDYTVAPGHTAADLDYVDVNSLTLNGGTIRSGGQDVNITLPDRGWPDSLGGSKDIRIDTTAPIVGSVTSNKGNGSYKLGDVIDIRVHFDGPVTVTGTPRIALNSNIGRTASYTSGSGSSTLLFNYTVSSGDSALDLDYPATNALDLNGGAIRDFAGNDADLTLPAVGGAGSLGGEKDIRVDGVIEAVINVTSDDGDATYKVGSMIQIKVVLDGAVTVTGSPVLALNTGQNALYNSGSGTNTLVFRYQVQAGDNIGDLNYTSSGALMLNGGSIKDAAGNDANVALPAAGGAGSLGTNKNMVIDGIVPGVINVTSNAVNGTYKVGDIIDIRVQFGETVIVTGTPRIALNTGATVDLSGGSGTDTLIFNYTVQAGNSISDLNYLGINSLSLNGGTIRDGAGNDASIDLPATGAANSLGSNKNIAVDGNIPVVNSVNSDKSNGIYKDGAVIDIKVIFSKVVNVTGTPQITLNSGRTVDYSSGSGTTTLIFNYTVQPGDTSADLDYSNINSLTLNGGTIQDNAGNDAVRTLPVPGAANSLGANKDIEVDTTAPIVSSVSSNKANGTYKIGDTIDVRVAFDGPVTVTGTPRLTLNSNITAVIDYVSGSGSSVLIFNYTVQQGDNTVDLNYLAAGSLDVNGGTIRDAAGNNADLTLPDPALPSSLGGNKNLVIDGIIPIVNNVTSTKGNGTYKLGDTIDIQVVFNKNVFVAGTPQIVLNTGKTVNYSAGSGSNTLVFNYTIGSGDSKPDLDYAAINSLVLNGGIISDSAGNQASVVLAAPGGAGSLGNNKNLGVDGLIPYVTNVTSDDSNGVYKLGDIIHLKVAFSENVSVTGIPQLVLNTGRTVNYTGGDGSNVLEFSYTVQAGDASLGLDYQNINALTGTIKDVAGNNANLTLPSSGVLGSLTFNKEIVVDAVSPQVLSVNSNKADGAYKEGEEIEIRVRFNEAVNVTGTPQLALNTGRTVNYIIGSGTDTLVFSYIVGVGETAADLDFQADNSMTGVIKDNALNLAVLTLPPPGAPNSLGANKNIVIDTTSPFVVNVTSDKPNGTYKVGDVIDIKVEFDSVVYVTGVPGLTLNSGRTALYTSGSGSNTLLLRYTVASGDSASDLDYTSNSSLTGTIKDLAQNAADLTLPLPGAGGSLGGNKNLVIDTTVPPVQPPDMGIPPVIPEEVPNPCKITGMTSDKADGVYTAGQIIDIKITFDKKVTVTGVPSLSLNSGGEALYAEGSGSSTLIFRYTVAKGDTTSDLDIASANSLELNGGTIKGSVEAGSTSVPPPEELSLPAPGSTNSLGYKKNLEIDTIVPVVINVTSDKTDGTYKEKDIIDIKVVFNEKVSVEGNSRLLLNTGAHAGYFSGSGTNTLVFRYHVGSNEDTDDLDYLGVDSLKGSIKDRAGNEADLTLAKPGQAKSLAANKNLVIDTLLTVKVKNVTSPVSNGVYRGGSIINIEVEFTGVVKVAGIPKLALNTGTIAEYVSGSGTGKLVFRYIVKEGDEIGDLDYMNANGLVPAGGTIKDVKQRSALLTLPLPGAEGSLGMNKDIGIDAVNPRVKGVSTSLKSGAYKAGTVIPIAVAFNEAVLVTGKPQISLNTGKMAEYASGSGSDTVYFKYTVEEGDNTPELNYTSTDALKINGGAIKDKAGNNVLITLPKLSEKGALGSKGRIVIDTIVPNVKDISIYRTGQVMTIKVSFTEGINVEGSPKVQLNGGRDAEYVKKTEKDELLFNYKIKETDRAAELNNMSYISLDFRTGNITDLAENKAEGKVKEQNYGVEIVLYIGSPYMFVNNDKVEIDPGRSTVPVIEENRTILPLRAVIEALGGVVGWDSKERKSTFSLGAQKVEMWVGSKKARENGVDLKIDVAPKIINSRTMMPLRFVTESFGSEVFWEGKSKKIIIRY
ncbi:MAG: PA14 domain-containing protein [Clostridia bacterium]|nr:PA14 domain-containing protein [Clostridia bacterium]